MLNCAASGDGRNKETTREQYMQYNNCRDRPGSNAENHKSGDHVFAMDPGTVFCSEDNLAIRKG